MDAIYPDIHWQGTQFPALARPQILSEATKATGMLSGWVHIFPEIRLVLIPSQVFHPCHSMRIVYGFPELLLCFCCRCLDCQAPFNELQSYPPTRQWVLNRYIIFLAHGGSRVLWQRQEQCESYNSSSSYRILIRLYIRLALWRQTWAKTPRGSMVLLV